MNAHTAGALGATGIALAHGVGMAVIVSMTMNISGGHINPAVTAALWLADKVNGRTALSYVLVQLVGALVGAPKLAETVTFMQGIWIEAMLTFFLVSAVFGTAVSPEAPKIGGFGIGLAIFVDALVGGGLTGAAMNPARAFRPAIVSGDLHGQAVWWIGPLLGAAAAGWLWRTVLLPKAR